MNRPLIEILLNQKGGLTAAEIWTVRPWFLDLRTPTDWRGLKAGDRAQPLTDLGRRLLGLHIATTTPKEN